MHADLRAIGRVGERRGEELAHRIRERHVTDDAVGSHHRHPAPNSVRFAAIDSQRQRSGRRVDSDHASGNL